MHDPFSAVCSVFSTKNLGNQMTHQRRKGGQGGTPWYPPTHSSTFN